MVLRDMEEADVAALHAIHGALKQRKQPDNGFLTFLLQSF